MKEPIYQYRLTVPEDVVDNNRHVNNVAYVKWMQDAAIRHSDTAGCTQATLAAGATWVVRTHHIEYRRPAFVGELISVMTWVVKSLNPLLFWASVAFRYCWPGNCR